MLFRIVLSKFILFCLMAALPASAQISSPFAAGFGSSGDETMSDMCVDAGGSYIFTFTFEESIVVAGGTNFPRTLTSNGLQDNGIARFDFLGNVQWALSWGNASGDERPVALACAADGSTYVVGQFTGTLDANPQLGTNNLTSAGESDVYLLKLDPAGNFAWARQFGGEGEDQAAAITADQDGNLLVTILYEGEIDADPDPDPTKVSLLTSKGGKDIAFLKIRPNGSLIWAKSIGGSMDDGTAGVATLVDNAGNVIMAGTFQGVADIDPGIAPSNFTSMGAHDIFLARYTPEGNLFRGRLIGGVGDVTITNDSLGMDDAGNVYLAGTFRQTIDVDPSIVTKTYTARQSSSDIFVASYNRDDQLRWSFQMGGLLDENVNTLKVDRNGILMLAGDFKGAIDLDPNSGQFNVLARGFNGASDGFAAKFRADTGAFVWGFGFGSAVSGPEQATTVRSAGLDTMGNLILAGNFFGTNTDFDPSAEARVLGTLGGSDLFLASYNWESKLRTPSTEITKPVLRATTNGGSFLPGGVVPGELATLFGLGMTTKIPGIPTPDVSKTLPIPTRLCNVEVIFTEPDTGEEFKAPILFCSQFQVNYQVPTMLPVGKYVELRIVVDEVASNALEVQVKPNDIGLFMESFQQRIGALVFAFGQRRGQKVNFNNTITACDIVEIYVTGLGNVAGGLPPDGTPATSARAALGNAKVVLYDDGTKGFIPTAPRFVELTSQDGFIQYTGVAPFFVGLYQVNMEWPNPQDTTIPRDLILFQGDYPAYVEFNGRRSQTFIIPVRYSSENPSPCRVL